MSKSQEKPKQLPDPLKPSLGLLAKLGSIVVHFQEAMSSQGHPFDREAALVLLADTEVTQWIEDMGVFLPKKR